MSDQDGGAVSPLRRQCRRKERDDASAAAVHAIRYDHDEDRDEVPVLPSMRLDVRLSRAFRMVEAFGPLGNVGARLTFSSDVREMHRIELERVSLYLLRRSTADRATQRPVVV